MSHREASFEEMFSLEHLKTVYTERVRKSSAVGLDKTSLAKFELALDDEISLINRKVLAETYSFTPYRQIVESKGAGKLPRILSIPTMRDRVTLRVLSEILINEFRDKARTPSPQEVVKGVVATVESEECTGYIKLDLSDFYGSIDHTAILDIIRSSAMDTRAVDLIERALVTPTHPYSTRSSEKNKRGLPQGVAIANSLANIYASSLDEFIAGMPGVIAYYRYVDDVLVLCEYSQTDSLCNGIKRKIEEMSLVINEDKTRSGLVSAASIDFLGYVMCDGMVTARESSKRRIEASLERQIKAIAKKQKQVDGMGSKCLIKQLGRRITGCLVSDDGVRYQRYGWLFYFSRMNDVSYLSHLDRLVQKLCDRHGVELPDGMPTFKKTYYQMRYNAKESAMFPRYSFSDATKEKRKKLEEDFRGFADTVRLSDEEVDSVYANELNMLVRGLERDVGSFS